MKRILVFLRSVLPSDPWQLVLLAGAVFLFISPRLDWYHSFRLLLDDKSGPFGLHAGDWRELRSIIAFAYLITFAGLSAYFTCFFPGPRPVRRLLWLVFLPCGVAILLFQYTLFSGFRPASSVIFRPRGTFAVFIEWLRMHIGHFPLAVYFSIGSMILIGVFVVRLTVGKSSLPVSLAAPVHVADDCSASPDKTLFLVFVVIAPLFIVQGLAGLLVGLPLYFLSQPSPLYGAVTRIGADVASAGVLAGLALWILGPAARLEARKFFRIPELHQGFFALLIPLGFSFLMAMPVYVFDRTNWAIYAFHQDFPPSFHAYFDFSRLRDPWLLLFVVGAFAEEFVFRGLLLRRLVLRYGFHRGLFLTGIVWAAYHFRGDSYSNLSADGVLLHLIHRILICLAMNYVLAWMTLRWKSIIPAGVAHTVSNMVVVSGINGLTPWSNELRIVEWAVLGILLFRHRPISSIESAEEPGPALQLNTESSA